jgi:Mycobacterium membrane protein
MSGPNTPDSELGPDPDGDAVNDGPTREFADDKFEPASEFTSSQAYSAPESEQITSAPYVPAELQLYDYDDYETPGELVEDPRPPRWPWVVGVTAIVAAIALVVSVALLVTKNETEDVATTPTTTTPSLPPVQDEITTTEPPPPPPQTTEAPPPPPPPPPVETVTVTPEPPPPPQTTEAPAPPPPETPPPPPPAPTRPTGPRQITYSVTGTKAPGDVITVTYIDASGRQRTQRNVYIPWSLTVTPISQSEVGSVQASSLFLVSRLNCAITTSDGQTLSANSGNSAQTSC